MSASDFINKYRTKQFDNKEDIRDYIKQYDLVTLKEIAKSLKSEYKLPGCSNKKKQFIIDILVESYSKPIEQPIVNQELNVDTSTEKFVIKKRGQEIIILSTKKNAEKIQQTILNEESLETRFVKLEQERNQLLQTIDNLTKENNALKNKINCNQDYVCNNEEKCDINSGHCIPNDDVEVEDDDDELDEFITEDGHKYIGNKEQISRVKERLLTQNQLISSNQQQISEPSMLDSNFNETEELDETDELANALDRLELRRHQNINKRINNILQIN